MKNAILELRNVSKWYGKSRGVEGLNLVVNEQEIVGFLGPNGAGKSTTINILLDIIHATSGDIILFGKPNQQHNPVVRREIGYISGDIELYGELTGQQFIDYSAKINKNVVAERVPQLASRLGAQLDKKIKTLSRGNRQKIALISVFARQTKLLILDEPTSGLDPLVQETFQALIKEYRAAGGTVCMSSHILSEVQAICDRVVFIREGKLISQTTLAELTGRLHKRVTVVASKEVLKKIASLDALKKWQQDDTSASFAVHGNVAELLAKLPLNEIDDITIANPELEELFMNYYEKEGANR